LDVDHGYLKAARLTRQAVPTDCPTADFKVIFGEVSMTRFSNPRTWAVSWCAAVGLLAICGSARAEVLFDSLDGLNAGSFSIPLMDATFSTGASSFRATDIALLLSIGLEPPPDETFTVSLKGGVPLADVSFDPVMGLNVGPGGPALASVTLPASGLSAGLAIEHFNQFANVTLQPNSLYWIDVEGGSDDFDNPVSWGYTSDVSGVGVAENYNSSNATDFMFFRNQGVPPFPFDVAFQMEVSGVATPELSTWALMVLGFGGLGFVGWRAQRKTSALQA
jgi:hypothetical protein